MMADLRGATLAALAALAAAAPTLAAPAAWDAAAAERYLDQREVEWQAWDEAQRDQGTVCASCHTQAPYGLARPVLGARLHETAPPAAETAMLASVEKRVRLWSQIQPVYSDIPFGVGKAVQSRNAEAVLNALMLAGYDRRQGHLRALTRTAFDHAWALQSHEGKDAGAWVWQDFGLAPWESPESQYHWAALMAGAVGATPDRYKDDPAIAGNLTALVGYLQRRYPEQVLLNRLMALRAARWLPAVLNADQRVALVDTLLKLQQADGGWSMTDLGPWTRRDKSAPKIVSDGYATAVVVLALEEAGRTKRTDAPVARGLTWLTANQDRASGAWPAWSVNKDRNPASMAGRFMSDAATAYAVLALDAAGR